MMIIVASDMCGGTPVYDTHSVLVQSLAVCIQQRCRYCRVLQLTGHLHNRPDRLTDTCDWVGLPRGHLALLQAQFHKHGGLTCRVRG